MKLRNYIAALLLLVAAEATQAANTSLPKLREKFKSAYVRTNGDQLIVGTGRMERQWQLTDEGLSTTSIKNNETCYEWSSESDNCDWAVTALIDGESKGELISLSCERSNDDQFTSDHLEVVAEFAYPQTNSSVLYKIWVYPDATGVRTQLFVRGDASAVELGATMPSTGVTFKSVKGGINSSYSANGVISKPIASALDNKSQVEVQVLGIDLDKRYMVGMTLWSYDHIDVAQDIVITSVDGENQKVVASKVDVPSYKATKATAPKELLFELPREILLDGSCRVRINGKNGYATISELYLYEQGDATYAYTGDSERIEALKANTPKGFTLSGYFDCGEKLGATPVAYNGYVDRLPVDARNARRSYVGYYNDTQHRNTAETPLIRQVDIDEPADNERINWANIVAVEMGDNGLAMVKESHKCVNQYGVDTGDFEISESGVHNSGLGMMLKDITKDDYKWCWASWSIVYTGDEADRQLAIKEFDRKRYPIDPSRDIYIQANTWGSDRNKDASHEENILVELDVQKQLGVDIQQIDDGWQDNNTDWNLRKDWYPNGWGAVRTKAATNGVKLGLWGAAMPIQLDDLKRTYDEGGFVSYKLDFASLGNHANMDALMQKIRQFVEYTDHKVRVNWDLTENAPRFGYYWAKEYGCIYLENRKPTVPTNVIYVPYLVLRDCWHLAQYTNINKFQTSVQNVDMVARNASDAWRHSQSYATAIGLSGVPLLFMETHFLKEESRTVMAEIFERYKQQRNEMFDSYVFSIGQTPDNGSWSGFQYINGKSGHLLIFREIENKEASQRIKLEFVRSATLKLYDTMNDTTHTIKIDGEGYGEFKIEKSGDFRLYRYEIMK